MRTLELRERLRAIKARNAAETPGSVRRIELAIANRQSRLDRDGGSKMSIRRRIGHGAFHQGRATRAVTALCRNSRVYLCDSTNVDLPSLPSRQALAILRSLSERL